MIAKFSTKRLTYDDISCQKELPQSAQTGWPTVYSLIRCALQNKPLLDAISISPFCQNVL